MWVRFPPAPSITGGGKPPLCALLYHIWGYVSPLLSLIFHIVLCRSDCNSVIQRARRSVNENRVNQSFSNLANARRFLSSALYQSTINATLRATSATASALGIRQAAASGVSHRRLEQGFEIDRLNFRDHCRRNCRRNAQDSGKQ